MKTRALISSLVFFALCETAMAAATKKIFIIQQQFALEQNGTLVLENHMGNIEVLGGDVQGVTVDAQKSVIAQDAAAIEEGRELTALTVGGDESTRVLRTVLTARRTKEWTSSVSWRVRIPRNASVRIRANASDYIRVINVGGNVYVKNFSGTIAIENPGGFVTADSVNGSISFNSPLIKEEVRLQSVNGHLTARVASNADLRWIADTIRGDIRTNLPVRGMFTGPTFRGSINAPGGTLLSMVTLMGNIQLFGAGMAIQQSQSVRAMKPELIWVAPDQRNRVVGTLRRAIVDGSVTHQINVGDVIINEIRGGANISTGAGQVQLGAVTGDCDVRSLGGALQLGEILGTLKASTRAGDILVEAARRGGSIETTGGTIRLLYTGGPTRLVSGGGDVVVRQAAGPVDAFTRSGDISITVDRSSKKQKIDAVTEKGNIVLNVAEAFGADIDLTIVTADPNANTILSDLPGLSIRREVSADGLTRVRATGKLNGGGERVTLNATNGSIRIITGPLGPTLVGR